MVFRFTMSKVPSTEHFHITSRLPYWCSKTIKRRPFYCFKPVLLHVNSFLMKTFSFGQIHLPLILVFPRGFTSTNFSQKSGSFLDYWRDRLWLCRLFCEAGRMITFIYLFATERYLPLNFIPIKLPILWTVYVFSKSIDKWYSNSYTYLSLLVTKVWDPVWQKKRKRNRPLGVNWLTQIKNYRLLWNRDTAERNFQVLC